MVDPKTYFVPLQSRALIKEPAAIIAERLPGGCVLYRLLAIPPLRSLVNLDAVFPGPRIRFHMGPTTIPPATGESNDPPE
jgi:hypothetical protein